jgi:fructose-1,6-bisphosphatase/inositol monophosphatase family enzyme
MQPEFEPSDVEGTWEQALRGLCDKVRSEARAAVAAAVEHGDLDLVARAVRQGAGDVTYAVDARVEAAIERWSEACARTQSLSLLTEDTGWRHMGPDGRGGVRALNGFDHGGPRIALDPIDGTRNLMCDLRSAWTVVSFAPPGSAAPRLGEVSWGMVSEIPDSRGARFRRLSARTGSACELEERELGDGRLVRARTLTAGEDARVDHGYFPIFRYSPDQRPALAAIEADFTERLRVHEGANLRHFFDDQYISNAGQLVLLSIGTYRMIADVRGWLATRMGHSTVNSHPYDVAGAIVCARAAGCVVEGPLGAALDFELDVTTPVDFCGFANPATARRIRPHLEAAMRAAPRA